MDAEFQCAHARRSALGVRRDDGVLGHGANGAIGDAVGGKLLAEITNRIVALMREHYGRGPIKAKTYVLDNLILCDMLVA